MKAPERWDEISRIYYDALGVPAAARSAYLARACGGDDVLHRELESLLQRHPQADEFIAAPAFELLASVLAAETLPRATPEQVSRLHEAFAAAMNRPAPERLQFLERVCALFKDEAAHIDRGAEPMRAVDSSSCSSCRSPVDASDHFCRACGTPIGDSRASGETRFRPGTLFAGRFRVVSALGRGGMGEVYRAEDLELGQTVALKFLTALGVDEGARQRLRTEVRLARQIAHPNVCRVYDIGESHGDLYLSMEYVDGEDLAGLLRRIGRVPIDKGIEMARKLAAGLGAAHAKGVLHRDLKPRNIMIDSRGEVRIMDFGLATTASEWSWADAGAGTPAYMAPEQLAGREPTTASDIYALGLVLYEIFTGRRPVNAATFDELRRRRESEPVAAPSGLVPEIAPAIERVILRCLEIDPRLRPASALTVATAMPGGDPLAEVLAAGQTPSPDLVAGAGPIGALRVPTAIKLLACAASAMLIALVLTPQTQAVAMLRFTEPPEVLASRARDHVRALGYLDAAADSAFGFERDPRYLEYMQRTLRGSGTSSHAQWRAVLGRQPALLSFWYRQSTAPLVARYTPRAITGMFAPAVSAVQARVIAVDLGLDGRLLRFVATPIPSTNEASGRTASIDWSPAFRAAHLDPTGLTPAEPHPSTVIADTRAAWTGVYPEPGELPIRVEVAAFDGRITEFAIAFPWSVVPGASEQADRTRSSTWAAAGFAVLTFAIILAIALIAFHNWRVGRGNVRGALIVGFYAFTTLVLLRLLAAPDVTDALLRRPLVLTALGTAVFAAAIYLAIEPWVRRRWPQTLITWSRILAGRWRDPLVGRDVLISVAAGLGILCLGRIAALAVIEFGGAPQSAASVFNPSELGFTVESLLGARLIAATIVAPLYRSLSEAPAFLFMVFLFRTLFRKPWAATAAFVIFAVVGVWLQTLRQESWTASLGVFVIFVNLLIFLPLVLRCGVFVVALVYCVSWYGNAAFLTTDFRAWYGQSSLVAVIALAALAVWGFRTSLGRQRIVGNDTVVA